MNTKLNQYGVRSYATFAREGLDRRLGKIVKIFSNQDFNRVLDVGCGDGSFSLRLKEASKTREVYGVEISPEGTELANKNGVRAFCRDIDAGDFPFDDSFFDAVFCGEIIEHLYNPDHLLEEVHRILNPGGLFVLSTPNLAWWLSRIAIVFGFYPFGLNPSLRHSLGHLCELKPTEAGAPVFADHIRLFTLPSLLKLLKIHGFVIQDVAPIAGQIPSTMLLSRLFNPIDRVLSIVPSLSFRFVVCGTKE